MSTTTIIAAIKGRHSDHSGDPNRQCDACKAVELLDKARTALDRVGEAAAKNQLDPVSVAEIVKEGRGP